MKIKMLFIVVAFALTACGGSGGGGGASTPGSAPVISDLYYYPSSASYMEGGGALEVALAVKFYDPDRDVTTLHLTDSDGGNMQSNISDWPEVKGKESSIVYFAAPADTSLKGSFTFTVFMTDSKGNNSNKLAGSFTVQ